MHTLTLKDNQDFALFWSRHLDPGFAKFKQAVKEEANSTCFFCGFKVSDNAFVINHDGDYQNNKFKNMRYACKFCTGANFLSNCNTISTGSFVMAYIPEQISQAAIMHLFNLASQENINSSIAIQELSALFKTRQHEITKIFGEKAENPAVFASIIAASKLSLEDIEHPLLKNIKLLPILKTFMQ